jgi:hypothetical protein
MEMNMKLLAVPPSKIQNKALPRYELGRYFDVGSAESLILALRQGQSSGYFTFDVTLSPEFFVHQKDKYDLMSGKTESFTPLAPLGMATYGMKSYSKNPLSNAEVRDIVRDFSNDDIEQYLRFTLRHIDYKKLRKAVRPKMKQVDKDEDYDTLSYNGLVAKGAEISYLRKPIYMSFQQRQVVRAFLKRPEKLLSPDMFIDDPDIFDPKKHYNDVRATLSKLIPEVHKKLQKAVVRQCIFNEPNEGWRLKIE